MGFFFKYFQKFSAWNEDHLSTTFLDIFSKKVFLVEYTQSCYLVFFQKLGVNELTKRLWKRLEKGEEGSARFQKEKKGSAYLLSWGRWSWKGVGWKENWSLAVWTTKRPQIETRNCLTGATWRGANKMYLTRLMSEKECRTVSQLFLLLLIFVKTVHYNNPWSNSQAQGIPAAA
jgi:hypothetical protein